MATVTYGTYYWGNTMATGGGGIVMGGDVAMAGHEIDNCEDLQINDIYDYDQGYIYFSDDIELDNPEQFRSDTLNLVIRGGTDPVVIGEMSVSGSYDDLYVVDDLDVGGTKDCVVKGTDGNVYSFSVIESPEIWFEEKISSQLKNGSVEIPLDERFIASTVIDESHPLQVIVSPTSNCNGLWVEKFYDKVIVHELNSGISNATFDITISAKRLGYEDIRFDERIYDNDTKVWYKKSKEAMFLEEKPTRIQMQQNKVEQRAIKEDLKNLRVQVNQKKEEIETAKEKDKIALIQQLETLVTQKNQKRQELKNKKKNLLSLREQSRQITEDYINNIGRVQMPQE